MVNRNKLKLKVISFNKENLCYNHNGNNKSPVIEIDNTSIKPTSYALIIEDPDAPINFIHWYLPYISPTISKLNSLNMKSINQNKQLNDTNLVKVKSGYNSLNEIGYHGPCNPESNRYHRYFFRLYALDGKVDNTKILSSSDFEEYLSKKNIHILDKDVIMYRYKNGGIPFLSNID